MACQRSRQALWEWALPHGRHQLCADDAANCVFADIIGSTACQEACAQGFTCRSVCTICADLALSLGAPSLGHEGDLVLKWQGAFSGLFWLRDTLYCRSDHASHTWDAAAPWVWEYLHLY